MSARARAFLHAAICAAACALAGSCLAGPADAATAEVVGTTLVFTATPGQANRIQVVDEPAGTNQDVAVVLRSDAVRVFTDAKIEAHPGGANSGDGRTRWLARVEISPSGLN